MPRTFYIDCGSDYHSKEALNGFRNKMEQCCELLDFKRGAKTVKTSTKDVFIFVKGDDLFQYENELMFERMDFKRLYHDHRKNPDYPFIKRVEDFLADGGQLHLPLKRVYWFAVKTNREKEEVARYPVVSTSQLEARRRFKKKYRPTYPMEGRDGYNYKFRSVVDIPEELAGASKEAIEKHFIQEAETAMERS